MRHIRSDTLFVLLYWLAASLLVGFLLPVFVGSGSRTRSLDVFKVGKIARLDFALCTLFFGHINSPLYRLLAHIPLLGPQVLLG